MACFLILPRHSRKDRSRAGLALWVRMSQRVNLGRGQPTLRPVQDIFNHINEDRTPSAKADFLRRQKGLRDLDSQEEPTSLGADASGQEGIEDSIDADHVSLLTPSH